MKTATQFVLVLCGLAAMLNLYAEDAAVDSEAGVESTASNEPKTELERQREQELAVLEHEKSKLELHSEIHEQKQKQDLATLELEKNRLTLENDIQEQVLRQAQLKLDIRKVKPDYLLKPHSEGRLIISDRRIPLNGPILPESADAVVERIHFYNNQNAEYPIFLVIDRCPGGSVMEGASIMEAMQHSQAPVYVVVKSVAASMAAIITAQAVQSYAYPNAMIVHHQIYGSFYGNNTEVSERLKLTEEWSNRVLKPVARKMGLELPQFVRQMYEHNTEGNWLEFATEAQKLGWVDHVVTDIRETSYIEEPEVDEEKSEETESVVILEGRVAGAGKAHGGDRVTLPPPFAGDIYHLYDPYKRYHY